MLIICENKTIPKTERMISNMAYLLHVALKEKVKRLDTPDDEIKTVLSVLDENKYEYDYFGPFNTQVQASISTQVQFGYLESISSSSRTRYELSDRGTMALEKTKEEYPVTYKYFTDIINLCIEVTQLNSISLSSASLLYFHLKNQVPKTTAINSINEHGYYENTKKDYENGFQLVSQLRAF